MAPSRREFETCFWLLDGEERAGTVALSRSLFGSTRARVSSLYLFPSQRGRGIGAKALSSVREVLAQHDLGIRLETQWAWQRVIRFYLRLGLWVQMWKHDLSLCWDPEAPSPLFHFEASGAALSVELDGQRVELAYARWDGQRLRQLELRPSALDDERLECVSWHATSTLALALALRGCPLVRSAEDWKEKYWADGGPPEALAYKLTIWEAWDRKHGWRVQTPKIPGLEYPTWDEFEER